MPDRPAPASPRLAEALAALAADVPTGGLRPRTWCTDALLDLADLADAATARIEIAALVVGWSHRTLIGEDEWRAALDLLWLAAEVGAAFERPVSDHDEDLPDAA